MVRAVRCGARAGWFGCAFVLAVIGCGDDTATGGSGGQGTGGAGGAVPEVCDGHKVQAEASFADTTPSWGLTGVAGGRVMSGDLNGDGFPDLIIHAFTPNAREVKGGDTHLVYVMMNEPADGGGRTFVDRTYESGFAAPADGSATELKSSQLAALADVDNDGDLDVFSGTYSDQPAAQPPTAADLDRSEIYLNDGTGKLTRKDGSGVQFETPKRTSSATFSDVDRNGTIDLFVGVHYTATGAMQAPALYLGNGDGTFKDASVAYKVSSERRAHFGVTSCDLDDDGVDELLTSAYARGPNVLLHMTGNGYEDLGEASTYAHDDNEDFHDNEFFKCWCTVHTADAECAGVEPPQVGCPTPADSYWGGASDKASDRLGGNTFSTVCRDIDGDGKLDLYEADIAHWWAGQSSDKSNLMLNQSTGPTSFAFARADRAVVGLEVPHVGVDWNEGGIVAAAADLNSDARPDLLLGASDYPDQFGWIFRQSEAGTFAEVGEAIGLHHPCAVGMTVADFDRDGDLDVIIASGTARDCGEIWATNEIHMYENGGEAQTGWLAVTLAGEVGKSNAAGIGAKVVVEAGGVTQTQELTSGYGHFGLQNDTALFFPLGDCTRAAKITVIWPDQTRSKSVFADVPSGQVVRLTQGKDTFDAL